MSSKQPLKKWSYIFKESQSKFLLVIVITIIALILFSCIKGKWWDSIEPIITILTLGVALFVWYQQISEEWQKDYLPKRFSGKFFYQGKEIMRFEKALLTNEGDIRALGQQIGSQMVNLQRLEFVAPEISLIGPEVSKNKSYIHYIVSYNLTDLPKGINSDKILVWKEPFIDSEGKPTYTEMDSTKKTKT